MGGKEATEKMDFRQFLRQYPAIELMERLERRSQNDDDSLEDIFQNIRGIREQTPERPVLNYGLSGTDLDEQENTDEETPQQTGGRRRPFKSKYSIFYPKMCDPEPDENENTSLKTNQKINENEVDGSKINLTVRVRPVASGGGFGKAVKTERYIFTDKGAYKVESIENNEDDVFEADKDDEKQNMKEGEAN